MSTKEAIASIRSGDSLYSFVIKTDSFMELPDHPNQRDTVKRAKYASKNHLKTSSPAHRSVSIVDYEGTYYKLDGHTRSHLWAVGLLDKPETVIATVIKCNTAEELVHYYDVFDNKKAAKTAVDNAHSAMRLHGVDLSSPLLASGRFSAALRVVAMADTGYYRSFDVRDTLAKYKTEMELLDSINPNKEVFRSGVVAAAIMLLYARGEAILPFLSGVNQNLGTRDALVCDPIFAASHAIETQRYTGGVESQIDIASRVLAAGERWLSGGSFPIRGRSFSHKGLNVVAYMRSAQTRRQAENKKDADKA